MKKVVTSTKSNDKATTKVVTSDRFAHIQSRYRQSSMRAATSKPASTSQPKTTSKTMTTSKTTMTSKPNKIKPQTRSLTSCKKQECQAKAPAARPSQETWGHVIEIQVSDSPHEGTMIIIILADSNTRAKLF